MRAKWLGTVAISLVAACIAGCAQMPATVPDEAWLVSPIGYDNAMDGEPPNPTDVTYSMQKMTSDTDGGFWTESAGSWLHVDRHRDARRFNDDHLIRVHAISAISPTVLAVSREEGGQPAGLYRFDTDNGSWSLVVAASMAMGDVVSLADGRLVFVEYPQGPPPRGPGLAGPGEFAVPYSIRSIDAAGQQSTLVGLEAGLLGSAVKLDATPDGTLYVSTESETFALGADGSKSHIAYHQVSHPVLPSVRQVFYYPPRPRGQTARTWSGCSIPGPLRPGR